MSNSVKCMFVFFTVVLSGSSSNANFRGFLVQGRTMNNAATGTFMDNGDDQQIRCDNVSSYLVYVPSVLHTRIH